MFNRVFEAGMIAVLALLRHLRSLRLAVQDAALSRRKQGFDSPRERQRSAAYDALSPNVGFRVRFFDSGLLFPYFLQPFFKKNNRDWINSRHRYRQFMSNTIKGVIPFDIQVKVTVFKFLFICISFVSNYFIFRSRGGLSQDENTVEQGTHNELLAGGATYRYPARIVNLRTRGAVCD